MKNAKRFLPRRKQAQLAALLMALAIGGWVVLQWMAPASQLRAAADGWRPGTGGPQLVRIQPLPWMDGEMCEWQPASFTGMLQQQAAAQASSTRPTPEAQAEVNARKPLRMIKDSFSSFSSIAVDIKNDEVVMTDESLFNIMTYNRLENTPPSARMSEPKRILGGLNTSIEYQCGVYIDQNTGDIYAVNNDTVDKLVIFSREQQGNVAPMRIINTPHTTYGIAVDEPHNELFLTSQEAAAVTVYHKMAKDEESPIRLLQGDKTLIADPHGIAVDSTRDLLFVSNFGSVASHERPAPGQGGGGFGGGNNRGPNWPIAREGQIPGTGRYLDPSITVYPRDAGGDVTPIRVISGSKAQLSWPTALAVDTKRGELYVANDTGDSILVFNVTDSGDVAPKRMIKGPKSMIKSPTGVFYDGEHDEVWVSNFGNHSATVYPATASGDVAPLRVIRSAPLDVATPNIGNAYAPAYDTNRDQIIVPNCVSHPQVAIFARMADGNAAPARAIAGQNALLARTAHGVAYDPVRDRIMIPNFYAQAIQIYRGDANGNAAPMQIIQGPKTALRNPDRLTFDATNNEILIPQGNTVLVFDGNAKGDVAPKRILGPTQPRGLGASNLAVDAVHNLLVVAGGGGGEGGGGGRFQIFDRTASGNAQPKWVIQGPHTELIGGTGPMVVLPAKGLIVVGIRANEGELGGDDAFVGVWDLFAKGDSPPLYRIGGPNILLRQVRGVTVNPNHKELIVTDKRVNALITYYFPEIF